MLNASVMSASTAMRVYIFHDRPFQVSVMNPFFRPHQLYDKVTLDDIRPYFQPPRYPTNDEIDSDTHLTVIISLDFNPSEPSYPSYHVETDQFEPSYPSVICLTSNSSSSSAAPHHTPPPVRGCRFIRASVVPHGMAVLEEEDVVMLLQVDSRAIFSRLMSDVVTTCGAKHEDSPFCF